MASKKTKKKKKVGFFGRLFLLLFVIALIIVTCAGVYVSYIGTEGYKKDFQYMYIKCNGTPVLFNNHDVGAVNNLQISISRPFSFITNEENDYEYTIEVNTKIEYLSKDGETLTYEGDITKYFEIEENEKGFTVTVIKAQEILGKTGVGSVSSIESPSSAYRLILSGGNQTVKIVFGYILPNAEKPSITLDPDSIIFYPEK